MSADKFRSLFVRTVRTDAHPPVRTVAAHVAQAGPGVLRAVTALVALCALTQFAIQAWLSYSFARTVWGIPVVLCAAVIAGLDLFVTVFMVLTYLLRTAHMRVRAYVWSVLFAGIGAQLFAAELFAQHERWETPVRVFTALPALFLAASLHGLIKYRQHASAPSDGQGRVPVAVPVAASQPAPPVAVQAADVPPAPRPVPADKPRRKVGRRAVDPDVVAEVRSLVAAGVSCADAARKLGKSKRWAEIHTTDLRPDRSTQRHSGGPEISPGETEPDPALFPKGFDRPASEMQPDLAPDTGAATDLETA